MPTDPRRGEAIATAVAAYDRAADGPLPLNAARLMMVMFPSGDVCQRTLEDIAGEGFDIRKLPGVLKRLTETGFLSKQSGRGREPNVYRLHIPPVRP